MNNLDSGVATRLLWFVNLAVFISFVKIFEIPPLIPILVDDLYVSYAQAGLFMSIYALTKCIASSPAGIITDKWGPMPIMSVSLLGMGIFGILGTISSHYELLLLWRVLMAVSVAVLFIAAVDVVPKIMPAEKVGASIGLINGSLNIGIAIALFSTPILVEFFEWRFVLQFSSVICLALFLFSLPMLKAGVLTNSSNVSLERDNILSFSELLKKPLVLLLAFATGVLFVEMYGVLTWVPSYLKSVHEYSASEVGFCSMMLGLSAIPASIVTGYLANSLHRILYLTLTGGFLASAGIVLLICLPLSTAGAAALVALIAWGHSQIIVTIMSLASIMIPNHSTGKALGIVFTLGFAGAIVSTYLGGHLVTFYGSYEMSFIIFSVCAVVSSAIMYFVYRSLLASSYQQTSLASA